MRSVLLCVALVALPTVDDDIKEGLKNGTVEVVKGGHTRDACDRADDIRVNHTTDGTVRVRTGETRFFKIDPGHNDYCKSGGWYWQCGNSLEETRIRGATTVMVVRSQRGITDWYAVTVRHRSK